jgi:uncharacterized protein YegL
MNKTELVFILDRSGSMGGLETDTIGGFNSTLEAQRKQEGEVRVSTILFDNQFEELHDRIDLNEIQPLTPKQYFVRGSTALYDAVALGVRKIANAQSATKMEARADKVIVVIITDGYENSSRETSAAMLKKLIEEKRSEQWEFIFMGANIDACLAAGEIGIAPASSSNYIADSQGIKVQFQCLNEAVMSSRSGKPFPKDWQSRAEADKKQRGQ